MKGLRGSPRNKLWKLLLMLEHYVKLLSEYQKKGPVANPNIVNKQKRNQGKQEPDRVLEEICMGCEDFPAGFSSWSSEPVVLRDIGRHEEEGIIPL